MKKQLKSLAENKFIQGGFFLTTSNFIVGFLNYLFNSLSGKLLGPEKYSEIAAIFAYLWILAVPSQVITTDLIRRLGAKDKDRLVTAKTWEQWFVKKIRYWWWLLIPYIAFIFFLPTLTNLSLLSSFVISISFLLSLISVFYTSSLLGLHLFITFSLILIFSTLIKLVGPILVYFHVDGLTTIAILLILSSVASVIGGKIALNHLLKSTYSKIVGLDKRIIHFIFNRNIIITCLSLVGITLLNNLDIIFAKKMFTSNIAGVYGGWSLFGKIIFYILSPILSLSYIFFSAKEQQKNHSIVIIFSLILLAALGIILYLLYSIFGELIVLIMFNKNYFQIIRYLPQAAIFGILYTIISFLNNFFISKNSVYSLIIAFLIFFYAGGLFFFGKSMELIIMINVIFSAICVVVYLVATVKSNSDPKSS